MLDLTPIQPLLSMEMAMVGKTSPYFLSEFASFDINESENVELIEWIIEDVAPGSPCMDEDHVS